MTLALWCVLLAGILPVLTVGLAKAGAPYDNARPRDVAERYEGRARRAYAAHQNGFEAFPLFAAAVLAAELKGAPRIGLDALAVAFILARIVYIACYVGDRATLRSISWTAGFLSVIAIFLTILWR